MCSMWNIEIHFLLVPGFPNFTLEASFILMGR